MKLPRRRIAQTDLATRHVEQFFPTEMPGPLGLAPGVAIAGLMPPVGRVLDRHDSGEQTAVVAASSALSLCDGRALLVADPGIEHGYRSPLRIGCGQRSFP